MALSAKTVRKQLSVLKPLLDACSIETAGTVNSSWSFKYFDQNWITPETIIERREKLNGMGINYLLNVGPDALGRIPSFSQEILLKAKK